MIGNYPAGVTDADFDLPSTVESGWIETAVDCPECKGWCTVLRSVMNPYNPWDELRREEFDCERCNASGEIVIAICQGCGVTEDEGCKCR